MGSETARLLDAARRAATASYSPYSKFRVGAAVMAGGKLYVGTNVENASYGLTICAERVAVFSAITDGKKLIDAIAVSCVDARSDDPKGLRMPCGACLQVINEFATRDTLIVVDGVSEFRLEELLPRPFKLK
jgi:cytidine deaminase